MKFLNIFKIILLFVFVLASCQHDTKLRIIDLKFPDYDKEKTALNNIDTTFLLDGSCKCLDPSFSRSWNVVDAFTGYMVYDKLGNIVRIQVLNEIAGPTIDYRYNAIGLPIYKHYMTDYDENLNANYVDNLERFELVKLWDRHFKDTCIFKFNSNGLLMQSNGFSDTNRGRFSHFKISYFYYPSGQLFSKHSKYIYRPGTQKLWETNIGEPIPTSKITRYFYSNNALDSTITFYIYQTNIKWNYKSVTYYKKNGLRLRTIDRDTISTIYLHKSTIGHTQ